MSENAKAAADEFEALSMKEQEQDAGRGEGKGEAVVRTLRLISSDNVRFEVLETLAAQAIVLRNVIDESRGFKRISPLPLPLPIKAKILEKIIEHWKKHSEDDDEDGKENLVLKEWDKKFLVMEKEFLLDMVNATSYLNSQKLFQTLCEEVANQIRDLSVEDVRSYFGIDNDFTPEEETKLREEMKWAFDK